LVSERWQAALKVPTFLRQAVSSSYLLRHLAPVLERPEPTQQPRRLAAVAQLSDPELIAIVSR
jgi:hypothetical protein